MPPGNWSDEADYPQGAELYVSDLTGGNVRRLTNNAYYEAEVTTSLDGKWVFFTRQIDGRLDIWKMRIDGTDEQQLTFTDDWQEGAPYPAPDGTHLIFRAWKRSDKRRLSEEFKATGTRQQTPMTIFTMTTAGTDVQPRTFTTDMNWAPFPAPDGRHFFYVRVFEENNWEVVMNDLAGGEPVRITYYKSFDGFPVRVVGRREAAVRPQPGPALHVRHPHLRDGHLLARRRPGEFHRQHPAPGRAARRLGRGPGPEGIRRPPRHVAPAGRRATLRGARC